MYADQPAHTNSAGQRILSMDTWLIAQCIAKLPRSTFFSHPESSLDDFFSGEAITSTDINHRDDHSSSVWQRPAPHELQFLKTLSQSLGAYPQMASSRSTEPGPCSHGGLALSSAGPESRNPSVSAGKRAMSQVPVNDCRSVIGTEGCRPPAGPIAMSSSLCPTEPTSIPGTSSMIPYMVSCASQDEHQSIQPEATTDTTSYQCNWEIAGQRPCGQWIEGGSKEVWIHVRTAHGLKGRYSGWCHCGWGGCLEKLKVSSLRRHLAKHLDIKWRCSGCDMAFSRCDYVRRHIKRSKECHGASCFPDGGREWSIPSSVA